MKITVLDRGAMGFDLSFSALESLGDVIIYDKTSPFEVIERIKDSEVVILNKVKITGEVMKSAPGLKLICVFATGYDNIDIHTAKERGIAVCNVPAYSTDSVALFTLSNVLYLYTHLNTYRNYVASGEYTRSGKANCLEPVYHEMRGMVWGIVGFGNIGRAVAKVAEALGAKIIVNKRTPVEEYECVDIDTICKESDIITVHCPLNEETRGLINEKRLSLMKKSVILVNEARGAVIDEQAVAAAVLDGRIGAFGSDVFSVEPFDEKHPFTAISGLENVCLTPHAAWGAYEARARCLNVIVDNIIAFNSGKIKNRVDI